MYNNIDDMRRLRLLPSAARAVLLVVGRGVLLSLVRINTVFICITFMVFMGLYTAIRCLADPNDPIDFPSTSPNKPTSDGPGTLYSLSPVIIGIGTYKDRVSAYDLIYQSTPTILGHPGVVTATLFVPKGFAPLGGWPLIAYAHPTTGVDTKCAPSLKAHRDNDIMISSLLKRKYAVIETDYRGLRSEGPHPYLHAFSAAYDVLDSVKAAYQAVHNLRHSAILLGVSQGGQAVEKAAEIAPKYAPEVHIDGVAEIVPPLNFEPAADALEHHRLTMAQIYDMPYVIRGMQVLNPQVKLSDYLGGSLLREFQDKALCTGDFSTLPPFFSVDPHWYAPLKPRAIVLMERFLRENSLPIVKVTAPVFISMAQNDTLVTTAWQIPAVKKMCDLGDYITFHYRPGDHSDPGSVRPALTWVDSIVRGSIPTSNCADIH